MEKQFCELASKKALNGMTLKSVYKIKNGGNISVVSIFGNGEFQAAVFRAAVVSASKKNETHN